MRVAIISGIAAMMIAGAVEARPPLRDVAIVDDGIMYLAIGNEIQESCSNISPRLFTAYRYLMSLQKHAKSLGYTDGEIRTYRKSDTEKARMRKRGEAYVRAQGGDPSNAQSLCALGLAEIARSSAIGVMLKEK